MPEALLCHQLPGLGSPSVAGERESRRPWEERPGPGLSEKASQAGIHLICVLKEKALSKGRVFQKGGIS